MSLKTAQEMGRPITFTDEGLPLTPNLASIDTVGSGVASTAIGDAVTMSIAGAGGLNYAFDEVLSGTGTSFTIAHTPSPSGSLILWKNGQGLTVGVDFSISGAGLTMFEPVNANDALLAKQYTY